MNYKTLHVGESYNNSAYYSNNGKLRLIVCVILSEICLEFIIL